MERASTVIMVSLVVIVLCSLVFFSITGDVVSSDVEQQVSNIIFYKILRVPINYDYLSSCFPKGEVIPFTQDAVCCDGLSPLGVIDESLEGCEFVFGLGICSDCGNSQCDFGENNCNCPSDCN